MEVGKPRSMKAMLVQDNATFNQVRNGALDLILDPRPRTDQPLSFFMSPRNLAESV